MTETNKSQSRFTLVAMAEADAAFLLAIAESLVEPGVGASMDVEAGAEFCETCNIQAG